MHRTGGKGQDAGKTLPAGTCFARIETTVGGITAKDAVYWVRKSQAQTSLAWF
jgi:hypothetical protein